MSRRLLAGPPRPKPRAVAAGCAHICGGRTVRSNPARIPHKPSPGKGGRSLRCTGDRRRDHARAPLTRRAHASSASEGGAAQRRRRRRLHRELRGQLDPPRWRCAHDDTLRVHQARARSRAQPGCQRPPATWRSTRGAHMPAEARTHKHAAASTRHAPQERSRKRVVLQPAWATQRLQATASTSARAKPLPLPEACRHLREPSHMRGPVVSHRVACVAALVACIHAGVGHWRGGRRIVGLVRRPDSSADRAGRARWLPRMRLHATTSASRGLRRGAAEEPRYA